MITGRELIEKMYSDYDEYEDTRLYSTGDSDLDDLLERAFCEGYEYAQRQFAVGDFSGNSADYKLKRTNPSAWVKSQNAKFNKSKRSLYGLDPGQTPTIGNFKQTNSTAGTPLGTQKVSTNFNKPTSISKPVSNIANLGQGVNKNKF